MHALSRPLLPALLAAALGLGLAAAPSARAQNDTLTRVLVDVADVVLRGGQPYYRGSDYGNDDRLIVERDRYGRPVYYRRAQQHPGPPYGNAYGDYRNGPGSQDAPRTKCNKHGKCKTQYYDRRYDQRGDRDDDHDHDDRDDRYWDGRRWRERDDD
ncbi:MAG TPA: hypothetical protein VNI56_02345 [Xanthomonadaceae bacterium]|nr:hypothetical protein [Xanthomonadaceae bacterium]